MNKTEIRHIQKRISDIFIESQGSSNFYSTAYMEEEITYWQPALDWIRNLTDVESVIDIGAAYGTLLLYAISIHEPRVRTVVDPIAFMPQQLIDEERILRITGDFEREELLDTVQYDLVIFTEVLEHLNFHPLSTLKKIVATLKSGGHLILTTPDGGNLGWGRTFKYYEGLEQIPVWEGQESTWIDDHIWQFTVPEVEELIKQTETEIIDFQYSPGVVARHQCWLLRKI